jgi:alpha-galactosidase
VVRSLKLAVIGAGSLAFTPELLAEVATSEAFRGIEIGLVDIDEEKLKIMERIASRVIEETKAEITVDASTDRREILRNADFVVITIAVGGVEGIETDVKIAEKYGIYHTVADTVGPAGFSRALRHIPPIVEICRDIEKICPKAVVFNETNPLTTICRAVRKVTKVNIVGLCTGVRGPRRIISNVIGCRPEDVKFISAGVNHLTWILEAYVNGKDVYPEFKQKIKSMRDEALKYGRPFHAYVSVELMETFGLYPVQGDHHISEFFPYFLSSETGYGANYGLKLFPGDTIYRREWRDMVWSMVSGWAEGKRPIKELIEKRMGVTEHSFVYELMEIITSGRVQFFEGVNIPNDGCIKGLPEEAVVEIPALVGPFGFRGISVGRLPKGIEAILQQRIAQQELTVEAALTGDRKIALQALALDPMVPTLSVAKKLLEDYIEAHKKFLPHFQK